MKNFFDISNIHELHWHDVHIHSFYFDRENDNIFWDIDYICEWIQPSTDEYFRFMLSPATVIFEDLSGSGITLDIDANSLHSGLELDTIKIEEITPTLEETQKYFRFNIDFISGNMEVVAKNFEMYLRKAPILGNGQYLTMMERGGISFEKRRF